MGPRSYPLDLWGSLHCLGTVLPTGDRPSGMTESSSSQLPSEDVVLTKLSAELPDTYLGREDGLMSGCRGHGTALNEMTRCPLRHEALAWDAAKSTGAQLKAVLLLTSLFLLWHPSLQVRPNTSNSQSAFSTWNAS